MNGGATAFDAKLLRLLRRWQFTELLVNACRLGAWILASFCLYALLDLALALESTLRMVLGALLVAAWLVRLIAGLTRIFRTNLRQAAIRADAVLGDRRRSILSAHELAGESTGTADTLTAYLSAQAIAAATGQLASIRPSQWTPLRDLRRPLAVLALTLLVTGLLAQWGGDWTRQLARRLVLPWRDDPPCSRISFDVTPDDPKVLYGGSVELAVELSGADHFDAVALLTRYQGKVQRVPCFQESSQRFAQKLEGIVSPVDFCFQSGRARSHWRTVYVLMRPAITMAAVSVTPPPYARLPRRDFFAGAEPLVGLKGARVKLVVASNRPLKNGNVTVTPLANPESAHTVEGNPGVSNTVEFAWDISEPARISVTVRDVQGTENDDTLELEQQVAPDEAPSLILEDPPVLVLATPDTVVPVAATVDDDLGLARVSLVRTVTGYRDRLKTLPLETGARQLAIRDVLDLGQLGVVPGETLELYVEALDSNPSLLGTAASEIARIRVISMEDYETIMRARIDAEEFLARYRQVEEAILAVQKELTALKEAAQDAGTTAQELQDRMTALEAANQHLMERVNTLKQDTPVFDAEKHLAKSLEALSGTTAANEADINAVMQAGGQGAAEVAERMLARLKPHEADIAEQTEDAEALARAAAVLEGISMMRKIIADQEELVRKLDRYRGARDQAPTDLLKTLGERQASVREELATFQNLMNERWPRLSADYAQLSLDVQAFVDAIDDMQITNHMGRAEIAASNQAGVESHREAALALEKLHELIRKPENCMSQMCQGQSPRFGLSESLEQTLQQMVQGINRRMMGGGMPGSGPGEASGGSSSLNHPVYGPPRARLGGEGRSPGGGEGRGGSADAIRIDRSAIEGLGSRREDEAAGEALPLESIPESYRNAVRRFFDEIEP